MATIVFANGNAIVAAGVFAVVLCGVVRRTVALGVWALVWARDGTAFGLLAAAYVIVALSVLANRTPKGNSSLQQTSSDESDGRKMHGE